MSVWGVTDGAVSDKHDGLNRHITFHGCEEQNMAERIQNGCKTVANGVNIYIYIYICMC